MARIFYIGLVLGILAGAGTTAFFAFRSPPAEVQDTPAIGDKQNELRSLIDSVQQERDLLQQQVDDLEARVRSATRASEDNARAQRDQDLADSDFAAMADAFTTLESSFVEAESRANDLQARVAELETALGAEERRADLLDLELSRVKQRLAEESRERIALEADRNAFPALPTDTAPVEAEVGSAATLPDEPSAPIENTEPTPPTVPETRVDWRSYEGVGDFTLRGDDQWKASNSGTFRVLRINADELDRASVSAFGKMGVVESGTQVSWPTTEGLYTVIVTKVNSKKGTVEIHVELER